ncbi:type I 3-dehydroquinate dehydratase [Sporolactobacillus putidus]|uniref:3-dehydroquinate dehydratase n=1 Tax=Sporolactobacillus putidus TaxID=492735 RepID=A0A917W1Y6_9BACL|nr:type I 3-dehydroquinate dehydratase [Sporolactobacillus putidus]GGL58375.1 3-dehydroquinate dehydratase [Sporolactobacillus putidus]
MRTVKVKNIELGTGIPKIAIPIVGRNLQDLQREIAVLKGLSADLVEWRADFFDALDKEDEVIHAASVIRRLLPDLPILFTFRTAKEGGIKEISSVHYAALNNRLIRSGLVDLVDVELCSGETTVRTLVETAHQFGVGVIMSNHEFHRTPSEKTMIKRLCEMQDRGADISKIAVMPKTSADVLTLLKVTNLMKTTYADRPFITMSMSGKGVISRLTGELFGSALTFGSAEKASAPGQISAEQLAEMLAFFHEQLGQ